MTAEDTEYHLHPRSDQRQSLIADRSAFSFVLSHVLSYSPPSPQSSFTPIFFKSPSCPFVSSDMQPPSSSPPPYSHVELGPDTPCYFNPIDTPHLLPLSSPASSSNARSYPIFTSSQPNFYSSRSSHSQPQLHSHNAHTHIPGRIGTNCKVRRRLNTGLASGSTSRLLSPTNSDSGSERDEGAIYTHITSRPVRRARSDPYLTNGSLSFQNGDASSSMSNGHNNGKKKAKGKKWKWSWRHWLFAIAAGVVGVGDGEWEGREREWEGKVICTTPGGLCAGETETETDEPSRHLPTARIPPSTPHPIILTLTRFFPQPIQRIILFHRQRLLHFLFEFCRLLSIVPAVLGTMWNLYSMIWLPGSTGPNLDEGIHGGGWGRRSPPERVDFFVATLWSILTGYQCLCLTTGLFTRWLAYYPPLATLIRLLALQGICWPATQVTLSVLDFGKRPGVCWAVIGTTTCASRAVVIWVTSNLVEVESETGLENETEEEEKRDDIVKADADDQYRRHRQRHASVPPGVPRSPSVAAPPCTCSSTFTHSGATLIIPPRQPSALPLERPSSLSSSHPHLRSHQGPRPRRKFKWNSSRRWDWKEVGMKCVLPGGMVYFVMAWLGEMRREWGY